MQPPTETFNSQDAPKSSKSPCISVKHQDHSLVSSFASSYMMPSLHSAKQKEGKTLVGSSNFFRQSSGDQNLAAASGKSHNLSMSNFYAPNNAPPTTSGNRFHRTLSSSLTWPSRNRSESARTQDSSRPGVPPSPFHRKVASSSIMDEDNDMFSRQPSEHQAYDGAPREREVQEEAEKLSTKALHDAVEGLMVETRVLQTELTLERDAFHQLYEGVAEHLTHTESRQDHTTNKLLRHLESLQRMKLKLQKHLKNVQDNKAKQESMLAEVKQNIEKLKEHLKREENVISSRIQRNITLLQTKRVNLENELLSESYNILQLENLVNEFQHLDASENSSFTPRGSRFASTASAANSPGVHAQHSPHNASRHLPGSSAHSHLPEEFCQQGGNWGGPTGSLGTAMTTASADELLGVDRKGLESGYGTQYGSRSASVASLPSTNATRLRNSSTPLSDASCESGNLRFLRKAITVLEHLRGDAIQDQERCRIKIKELQNRVDKEMFQKKEELRQLEQLHEEISYGKLNAYSNDRGEEGIQPITSGDSTRGPLHVNYPHSRGKNRQRRGIPHGRAYVSHSVTSNSSHCDPSDFEDPSS